MVTAAAFERLRLAASRHAARTLRTKYMTMRSTRPLATICFDDFPANAATAGARVLERHGVRGSFYVSGALCEREWETGPQVTREMMVQLVAAGHEIGCHTFSHGNCMDYDDARLEQEVARNAAFARDALGGYELSTFAYPYGQVGLRAKAVMQKRFAACRGIERGVNHGRIDLGLLKSIEIPFQSRDQQWLTPWQQEAAATNGWLILFTHDVSEMPGPFGCTPAALDGIILQLKAAGFDILPLKTALAHAVQSGS